MTCGCGAWVYLFSVHEREDHASQFLLFSLTSYKLVPRRQFGTHAGLGAWRFLSGCSWVTGGLLDPAICDPSVRGCWADHNAGDLGMCGNETKKRGGEVESGLCLKMGELTHIIPVSIGNKYDKLLRSYKL